MQKETKKTLNRYKNFEERKTTKLFRKYNLRYDLKSLSIVMEIKDELTLIERLMLEKIKSNLQNLKESRE